MPKLEIKKMDRVSDRCFWFGIQPVEYYMKHARGAKLHIYLEYILRGIEMASKGVSNSEDLEQRAYYGLRSLCEYLKRKDL